MLLRRASALILALLLMALSLLASAAPPQQDESAPTLLYLPFVLSPPKPNAFGIQTYNLHYSPTTQRARELGSYWARIDKVSWRAVQPVRGGAYNWSVLAPLEADLLAADAAGISPILVLNDSPRWATILPSSCSAIRSDRFADFAAFLDALVRRYSQPPFNVHHWEIGNEPDVDPALVPTDQVYGCWGNISDPYYGGGHYGNMLKAVVPTLRAADPSATVWMGGLLLNAQHTSNPALGHPEKFLEGILRVGAAPYFDIVPYHSYQSYEGRYVDHSNLAGNWGNYGSVVVGKPTYLREVMAQYGVNKPLYLNEAALHYIGSNPPAAYFEAQADHLVRAFVRSLYLDVKGVMWFTLEGPGWRSTGLLADYSTPRASYHAYKALVDQVGDASPVRPTQVTYGAGVEGYRFATPGHVTDVLWSRDAAVRTVSVPQPRFVAAFRRDGSPLLPTIVNGAATFSVGFEAIYIQRQP